MLIHEKIERSVRDSNNKPIGTIRYPSGRFSPHGYLNSISATAHLKFDTVESLNVQELRALAATINAVADDLERLGKGMLQR